MQWISGGEVPMSVEPHYTLTIANYTCYIITDYFDQISQEGFVNRNILVHFIRDIILVTTSLIIGIHYLYDRYGVDTWTTAGGLVFPHKR